MRICISGACGFIGYELAKKLKNLNYEIVAIDDMQVFKKRFDCNLSTTPFDYFYDYKDIYLNSSDAILDKVDFTFHLGANSSTRATLKELSLPNLMFSYWFIKANFSKNIPLVFASSGAVFGSNRNGNEHDPQTEYGLTKSTIEKFIHSLPLGSVIALRYHNVYGATESHKGNMASIVSKWFDRYFEGNSEPNELFFGSEMILRDFIHVDDVNDINTMMLDFYNRWNQLPDGYVMDVGVGIPTSFQEVANEILKHTKGSVQYIINPYNEKNYQFFTKADIKDLCDTYMWMYDKPFNPISIEHGIAKVFKDKKEANAKQVQS